MAYRDVRSPKNKLVFKFDPDADRIKIMFRGEILTIELSDYRPLHQRTDKPERMCYTRA